MSKKALLVGINYRNTKNELLGPINDIYNIKKVLIDTYGYKDEDITVVTDSVDSKFQPTKQVILTKFLELILSEAKTLTFYYSGHGSQAVTSDVTELDGLDECLVPIDFKSNGMILDNEMTGILECLTEDKTLTLIIDACHSNTILDLNYHLYSRLGKNYLLRDGDKKSRDVRGQVILISGCKDEQTSADAYILNQNQGALTYSIIDTLTKTPVITYDGLLNGIKNLLKKENYTQVPQLSTGKQLDINFKFNL